MTSPERRVPFDSTRPLDLISVGRVAVDFYAEQIGSPLHEARSFRMYLGGSPANVAVGAARLGLRVEMFSRVGADDLGRFLRQTLVREGVGTRLLADDAEHLSGLVILGVAPPDRFPLIFFRENCADMETRLGDESDRAILSEAKALHVTGTGLSRASAVEHTLAIVHEARRAGCAIVFDVDYRPVLWGLAPKGDGETRYRSSSDVTATMRQLLPLVDLVVGTEEELCIAGGDDDVDKAIATLREGSSATIVCKRGVDGCSVFVAGEQEQRFAGRPVEVLNVLGAGDAFLAGFLRGWLREETIATAAAWANANGALVVSRHGCSPAMGSMEEIRWFLEQPDSKRAARSPELAKIHRRAGRRDETLLVLAFDHRLQFEEEADAAGVAHDRIAILKRWIFEGFERVARRSSNKACALLVDPIYGAPLLAEATASGWQIGAPIEQAGSTPTRWLAGGEAYPQILARPARWFVKALFRMHPDDAEPMLRAQLERLTELQSACDDLDRDLMIEIVEPDGVRFADGDLPRLLANLSAQGIEPRWWKLPPLSAGDWRGIEKTLDDAHSGARIIMLGGGQPLPILREAFGVAASSPRAAGFAVGRSVFGDAAKAFFAGTAGHETIVGQIAERYGMLVDQWQSAAGMGDRS